jgi:hypothetical protein
LGVGSDWFGSLLKPSAIAIGSWYIIPTDGMNQPLEQGVKQEPVAAVICHLSSFYVWHQSVHPFARPMVAINREMSFQGPF